MGETRKLYDHFSLTLTPQAESAMQNYLENDTHKTRKPYKYSSLEDYGITREDLQSEFSEYIELMKKRTKLEYII